MPDNKKPTADQKIIATNGSSISGITQIVQNVYSDTENFGTSDELTISGIVATILYYTISLCAWLGCLVAPYCMIKLSLGYYSTVRGQPDASIILFLIPLSIFTIPWIPEKILKIKMSTPLRIIYSWVMLVIVCALFYVVGKHLGY